MRITCNFAIDARIVGCKTACVEEGIGLSEPVQAAIDEAAKMVRELIGVRLTSAAKRDRP